MPPAQVALSLLGIIVILIGAYYATYYIGTKASGKNLGRNRGRNRSINLLERFAISRDKSFCIVEIAGKVYFIGVTNQTMALLDKLDAEEFEEYAAENDDAPAWSTAIPGGQLGSKLAGAISSYLARRAGKNQRPGESNGRKSEKSGKFEDAMESARAKDASGKPDRAKAERQGNPEEE